jgi:uncharacterized membrane protein
MTLLVLGIEVPEGASLSGPELASTMEKLGHQVLIYLVSFLIVAMYWSQYSLLFGNVRRMDRPSLVLNLFFLLPVTLLPFVTQLMGSRRGDWKAVALFALTNLFAALVFGALWRRVVARPETHKGPQTIALGRRMSLGLRFFVAIMIAGVLIALVDVRIGILCFVLMPLLVFYNYVRDPLSGGEDRAAEAHDSSPD